MNPEPTPYTPPDFTDNAAWRAYVKASAAGLVRIASKSPDRSPAALSEFADEAGYRAYLKAEAAGLVQIYSKSPEPVQAPAQPATLSAPASPGQPQASARYAALTSHAACLSRLGKNEPGSRCEGFLDLVYV